MPRMRRPLLRTIGLMLAGIVLGSLIVEGYLRLAELEPLARALPSAQASLYGPDQDTGYAHRPGAKGMWLTENRAWVEVNSLGLRDRADRGPDSQRYARLGIVGDSFVEALQVPLVWTFTALAEQRTALFRTYTTMQDTPDARLSGRPIEILNLGLAGATPAVTVQRLRTLAPKLDLDAAIVILGAGDLLRQRPDDTSEFVGYVPGPDGTAVLSHAFRETRGYKFRAGPAGRAMYWLLDHSRLALLLNNRKNAGLLAELAEPPRAGPRKSRVCTGETLKPHEDLWSGTPMGFAQARLDAILFELKEAARARNMIVAVGLRGLPVICPGLEQRLAALKQTIAGRMSSVDARGLGRLAFFDIEAAAARHLPPGKAFSSLFGWGTHIGSGHLNELGHQVYAKAIVDLLEGRK